MNVMELKREKVTKIEEIKIDISKSVMSRMNSYLEQTKNPFAQNIGAYIVQIGFMDETNDLIEQIVIYNKEKIQIDWKK